MHVDVMISKHGGIGKGLEGREPCEGFGAQEDPFAQTGDEVEPVEGGEIERFSNAHAAINGREEAWTGRGIDGGFTGTDGKLEAWPPSVTFAFARGEPMLASYSKLVKFWIRR